MKILSHVNHRVLLAFAQLTGFASCILISASAQSLVDDDAAYAAKAMDVRRSVVEGYGDPNFIARLKSDAKQAFVEVFVRFSFPSELTSEIQSHASKRVQPRIPHPKLFPFLRSLIDPGSVPYLELLVSNDLGIKRAQEAGQKERELHAKNAKLGEARQILVSSLVKKLLPAEDVEKFDSGTEFERVGVVFKAEALAYRKQEEPNAFAIFLCDVQNGEPGDFAREQMLQFAPNDQRLAEAAWNGKGDLAHERIVTLVMQEFFDQGATSLLDAQKAEAFVTRIAALTENTDVDEVLRTMGPSGLERYKALKNPAALEMSQAARALDVSMSLLLPSMIGPAETNRTQ